MAPFYCNGITMNSKKSLKQVSRLVNVQICRLADVKICRCENVQMSSKLEAGSSKEELRSENWELGTENQQSTIGNR